VPTVPHHFKAQQAHHPIGVCRLCRECGVPVLRHGLLLIYSPPHHAEALRVPLWRRGQTIAKLCRAQPDWASSRHAANGTHREDGFRQLSPYRRAMGAGSFPEPSRSLMARLPSTEPPRYFYNRPSQSSRAAPRTRKPSEWSLMGLLLALGATTFPGRFGNLILSNIGNIQFDVV
jgi:hypothetical protein